MFLKTNSEIVNFFRGYFTGKEVCCKCGAHSQLIISMDGHFARMLYIFRVMINYPVIVRSAYRCPMHKDYSENHAGYAIDVVWNGTTWHLTKIIYAATQAGFRRIIVNVSKKYVHLDCNPQHDGTPLAQVFKIITEEEDSEETLPSN